MSLKDRLKARIKADGLFGQLISTIREPPGTRWLDKPLAKQLLVMAGFEYKKLGGLELYTRPLEGEKMEIVVLDNELPIYHSTLSDVALRKAPYWQEMFSLKNIKKIMNHHDVLAATGKESLRRIHEKALALIDLTYGREDLAALLEEAGSGIEQRSFEQIRESLDLFSVLFDYRPVFLQEIADKHITFFARPKTGNGGSALMEDLVIFNEEKLELGLRKGTFSPGSDLDLAWVMDYVRGRKKPDFKGREVFAYMCEAALERAKSG